jgi:REP element-mobilizing transposase RayT
MSHIRILVHCVWTTKNRLPVLKDDIRDKIIYHIRKNALKKGIYIDHINGYHQHLHALISLGGKQDISDVMQLIKGESSFWINKNKLTGMKFEWQDDFYSVSIGISQLYSLRQYIRNQPGHHAVISFKKELEKIIEEYQLDKKLD